MGRKRENELTLHFEGCNALHRPLHLLTLKLKSVTLQSVKCNVTPHSPLKGECNAHCNASGQRLPRKELTSYTDMYTIILWVKYTSPR